MLRRFISLKISNGRNSDWRSQAYNLTKKETLAQVFSCEFCEIFKKTFLTEQLAASLVMADINKR